MATDTPPQGRRHAIERSAARPLDVTVWGVVGLSLFVLLKTYGAAHYSLTTASALLTGAPAAVLLGTITSYEYLLWPVIAAVAAGLALWHQWVDIDVWLARVTCASVAVAAAFLSPLWYLATALFAVLVIAGTVRWYQRPRSHGRVVSELATRPLTIMLCALVVACIGVVMLSLPRLWLPAEVMVVHAPVRVTGSSTQVPDYYIVVGHNLGDQGGWTTFLRAEDRRLMRIPTTDIARRHICRLTGSVEQRSPLILDIFRQHFDPSNVDCAEQASKNYLCKLKVTHGSFSASSLAARAPCHQNFRQ